MTYSRAVALAASGPDLYLNMGGCFRWKPVASWYFFATAQIVASSNRRPMKLMLIGVPSFEKPFGTTTTG